MGLRLARPVAAAAAAWAVVCSVHAVEAADEVASAGEDAGDGGSASAPGPPERTPRKKTDRRPTSSPAKDRDGPGRRRRQRRSSEDRYAPTRAALTILADLIGLCGGGIGWCLYLECKPEVARMKFCMIFVLVCSMMADLCLYIWGFVAFGTVIGLTMASIWGSIDAVMRFPVLHSCDGIFTAKQILILLVKIVFYAFGFKDLSSSKLLFFSLLLINVVGLPLMYILALPLDDKFTDDQMKGCVVVDVDLGVRLFRAVATPEGRQQFAVGCRRRGRTLTLSVGQRLPEPLQDAITKVAPWYKRAVQTEKGRSV